MGRGRAKAKQTKVARELKYSSPTMDLDALQREIGSAAPRNGNGEAAEDDYADPYAPDTEDDDESPQRRYR
ncbi:hypothetical protein BJF78_28215 [Pseudonocardia sp. CNS-139]|nr:hypothetical protein BJF78_28215 [Pseudonocardia sp. CNS-139]